MGLSSAVPQQIPAIRPVPQQNMAREGELRMRRPEAHYCIATAGELWFERLDFEVF